MTIQLNPPTTDPYEQKTLADIRQRVFNALGFLSSTTGQPDMVNSPETLGTMRTYIFNMLGLAAMAAFPPPGVMTMINGFINMAQQTAFRRLELSSVTYPSPTPYLINDTDQLTVDPTVVRMLALASSKAHYGQEDAEIYLKQADEYFKQVAMRVPPNAYTAVTRIISDAQFELYRRFDLFRTERWFTWTFVASQRFYGIQSNDERLPIAAPTGVTVTAGAVGAYGSLSINRALGNGVLLNDGRVLFIGGNTGVGQDNTAETYDPSSTNFTPTGPMSTRREQSCSVLLPSGQVMVAGGINGLALNQIDLYDPPSNTFIAAGNMLDGRYGATATLLKNGKVLIAGGFDLSGSVNTAEIFDPSTSVTTFTTGGMNAHRGYHTATLLPNGNVLIAGGVSNLGVALSSAEIYDPVANTFTAIGSAMSVAIFRHNAVPLTDGTVLLIGGATALLGPTVTATSQIYNPASNSFSNTTGALATARAGGVATLLPNGKVIVFAGEGATQAALSSSEIYDPVAKTFSAGPSLVTPRILGAEAVFSPYTQRFYIAGGYSTDTATVTQTMEIYDYPSNSVQPSGQHNFSVRSYRVAFSDKSGKTTNTSPEVSASVNGDTAVIVTWTIPANTNPIKYALIYGRSAGTEKLIAQVDVNLGQYIDYGTIVPSGAYPTSNSTGNSGPIVDQRKISWVGVSRGDVDWRALSKGVPPEFYSNQTNGIPAFYDIHEEIEVWPPPMDATWQLHIKGHYILAPFEADTDYTSLDWQAVYLAAVADAKVTFKQPDANLWQAKLATYIGDLVAGQHGTSRYTPGTFIKPNATRPVLLNSQGQPI